MKNNFQDNFCEDITARTFVLLYTLFLSLTNPLGLCVVCLQYKLSLTKFEI
jgi:hypothetical protein